MSETIMDFFSLRFCQMYSPRKKDGEGGAEGKEITNFCISIMTIAVVDLFSLRTLSSSTWSSNWDLVSSAGGSDSFAAEILVDPSGRFEEGRVRSTSPDGYSTQKEPGLPNTRGLCTLANAGTTGAAGASPGADIGSSGQ